MPPTFNVTNRWFLFVIKTNNNNNHLVSFMEEVLLPGISLPPQEQSGRRQTSVLHLAADWSGVGCGKIASKLDRKVDSFFLR